MFDVAPTEFLLIAVIALLVIGPKDLPRVMRAVGHWVAKARGVARQFRSGFDEMIRESELAEMEKKWREENDRIMSEFPADAPPAPLAGGAASASPLPQAGGAGGGPLSEDGLADTPTPDPSRKREGK